MNLTTLKKAKSSIVKSATKKTINKKYYGEISLATVLESNLNEAEFMSLFDSGSGIKAKLVLETYDGEEREVEILDIVTNWTNWNDI